ncbi:hypothetical protein GQX74_009492 [Glossina fuscipes]|nr:hypothetical protein GQX74_009492 [Glossina fuscipes]
MKPCLCKTDGDEEWIPYRKLGTLTETGQIQSQLAQEVAETLKQRDDLLLTTTSLRYRQFNAVHLWQQFQEVRGVDVSLWAVRGSEDFILMHGSARSNTAAVVCRYLEECLTRYAFYEHFFIDSSVLGVTVPGYQGNLQAAISHNASLAAWERLGVEFILTFVVVLTYFISTDSVKKVMGNSAPSIAASYSACSFVSMPYLNPARSLGPSFVLNKWENHWVYWFGPLIGGFASGLVYEYIFNTRRNVRRIKINMENDTSSINSEDDLNYDLDMEKPNMHNKFQGTYPTAQATSGHGQSNTNSGKSNGGNYCQNLYTTPPLLNKFEQSEPLYGGTRSMYCRSPTLMRTNLNRSQSVYAKSNTALNRDIVPRSGPLVPAQSLYPLRLGFSQHRAQSSHLQNQNVQNQLQQRSESVYAIRSLRQNQLQQQQQQHSTQIKQQQQQQRHQQPQQAPQHMQQSQPVAAQQGQTAQENQACFQAVYGTRLNPNPNDGHLKFDRRPETVYGMTMPGNRGQSAQSDDSSYGSYPSSSVTPPARTEPPPVLLYAPPPHPNSVTTPPLRTQSERKVSAPVVASQASTISMGQYNANQSSTPNQTGNIQNQPQQQQIIMQHAQQSHQHQHYTIMPLRSN